MYPFCGVKTDKKGVESYTGLCGYSFGLLQQSLKFNYTTHRTPEFVWGGRGADGKWAGQLGMVARNIWVLLAGISLFLAVLLALQGKPRSARTFWKRCYDVIFELLGNIVLEASARQHRSHPSRMIIAFWWMSLVVMMNTFTGHMKASMAVQKELPRVDSIQDILDRPKLIPVIIRGSTFEEVFTRSPRKDDQLLWQRVKRMKSILPSVEVFSKDIFDDVLAGRKVVFLDTLLFVYWVGKFYSSQLPRGEFYLAKYPVLTPIMSMWANKNLDRDVIKALHERSRWITESGMADHWKLSLMDRSWRAVKTSGGSEYAALKTADVMALLFIWLAGVTLASVVFVVEICLQLRFRKSASFQHRRTFRTVSDATITRSAVATTAAVECVIVASPYLH
ncbi:uncharacterized protein LOC135393778 isoform X2 [Ornithodoros turicata]|uniref:uncharacterized protein LOC135393778 isoform X2 n=1 Tax=Ornithodoros turicata TaxID=34597 RepID=UPI003138DE1B